MRHVTGAALLCERWVMLEKHKDVAQDIRRFVDDKDFPKESVHRR